MTLSLNQLPAHTHTIAASSANGQANTPAGQTFAGSGVEQYETSTNASSGPVLGPAGGGQEHANLMPYLTMNYIISLFGTFPSQS